MICSSKSLVCRSISFMRSSAFGELHFKETKQDEPTTRDERDLTSDFDDCRYPQKFGPYSSLIPKQLLMRALPGKRGLRQGFSWRTYSSGVRQRMKFSMHNSGSSALLVISSAMKNLEKMSVGSRSCGFQR